LLAAIIQRGGDDVLSKLNEDDFANINNKKVFETVKQLWLKGETISPSSVYAANSDVSIADIISMDDMVLATKDEIDRMAAKVKNISALRKINKLTLDIQKDIKTSKDAKAIKTKIFEALDTIDIDIQNVKIKNLKTVLFETTDWIENQYVKARDNDLMLTGIPDLDYCTGGLFDGEMTVIAARPSVGKTALGLFIAIKLAREGRKVHFVSREMSSNAIGMRILSMASGIDTGRIKAGKITEEQWQKIAKALGAYSTSNLIIDTDSKTPSDIKAVTKEIQAKDGLDLVIIDYLQILTPDGRHNTREQEVASISRSLKNLSLDLNKPVIVLAQLNRNAENKRPTLADLRESGAIEADADNVWFLHYPTENQLYDNQKNKFMVCKNNNYEYMEIIIGKHRNGPVGMIDVIFDPG
ncbi:MAG TPA: DnaB-like helicase C-terminal domain-containing protein, partial [Fervidobacterium sp.]|nr:DnaB-like helicase C-terminal domain-containing protein [Fervidobacterium sp.]